MKKHIVLLFTLVLIVFLYNILLTFVDNYRYSQIINRGIKLYTAEKANNLTFDEYWLLQRIVDKTGNIPNHELSRLEKKYKENPFKRLINKNDYTSNLAVRRNMEKIGTNEFYEIANLPDTITNWDHVFIKALYCDKTGYDDQDFKTLSTLKNKGGYNDTHYLLGLLILKENTCYQKEDIEREIKDIALDIIAEQNQEHEFSDLYSERIVVLYWAGFGKEIKKEWINVIAKSYNKNLGWYDKGSPGFNAHATGLSLLSLIYYAEGKEKQFLL